MQEGIPVSSFDHLYESSNDFEEVYSRIAQAVLDQAKNGDVVYAVPGHPLVGEETVRIIMERARVHDVPVQIMGSASFIEACVEALVIPVTTGLKIVDALSLERVPLDPDVGNLVYQIYDRLVASEVKLKLMQYYPDDQQVKLIKDAGTPEQSVTEIPLYELDRQDINHLTTLFVPPLEKGSLGG